MATIKGCKSRILVGGVDLSGESNAVGVQLQSRALEYGVMQDCDVRKLPLTPQGQIEHRGYYSGPDVGKIEHQLYTYLGSNTGILVAAIYDTDATIPFAYVQDLSFNQRLQLSGRVGQLLTINGMWNTLKGAGAKMHRGYQVFGGDITGTGAIGPATGTDAGAAGTNGGKLYLFVTSITGTATSAAIKLQSAAASNFASPADEATITFSAVGAYSAVFAGAIDRYLRMNVTSLGGATGFTAYAIACVDGVTE